MSNLGQALLIPALGSKRQQSAPTDAFTAVDGTALTTYNAHWVKHTSATNTAAPTISGGRVFNENAATNSVYYRDDIIPTSPNYTVRAGVVQRNAAAGLSAGVIGRCDIAAANYYLWRYSTAANTWELYKIVAGTPVLMGSFAQALTLDQEYSCALVMTGTSIVGMVNGVSVVVGTNAEITATGRAGIRSQNQMSAAQGVHLDSWSVLS